MTANCQLAQRTLLRAFRAGKYVLIVAEGELPTPGFDVDIEQSPLRIFPPQFNSSTCCNAHGRGSGRRSSRPTVMRNRFPSRQIRKR